MILVNSEIKRLASFHNDTFQTSQAKRHNITCGIFYETSSYMILYPQLKKGTDLDGLDVIDIGCQCNDLHNISKTTCIVR